MKKLAALLLLMSGISWGQMNWSVQGIQNWSYQGYPHVAMPGSDHIDYVMAYGDVGTITAFSWNGVTGSLSRVTYTANNTLSVNDWIEIWDFSPNTGTYLHLPKDNMVVYAATPTTFTVQAGNMQAGDATSGAVTTGDMMKWWGAGMAPNVTGTWSVTQNGTDTTHQTIQLYRLDGTAQTSFVNNPTITGAPAQIGTRIGSYDSGYNTCTKSGALATANLQLHCPVEYDLKFTLDADPTKTYTYHYIVSNNGGGYNAQGKAFVHPGYRQVYTNRTIPLFGEVFGHVNQMINWTITSAPGGGDASLVNATYPQPAFVSGTVAGKYLIKGCPAVDASAPACDTLAIYVSASSPPAANADGVELSPCEIDPTVTWGTVVEVDPTGTVPGSITDFTLMPQFPAGSTIYRYWNKGANGNPTTLHSEAQFNMPTGGPFTPQQPATYVCGVANPVTGELPILDATNANVPTWSNYNFIIGTFGILGFNSFNTGGYVNTTGGIQPFSYVTISNLTMQHARNVASTCAGGGTCGPYVFNVPGGGTLPTGDVGLRLLPVQYGTALGNHFIDIAQPMFDDCNTGNTVGYAICSMDNLFEGNHIEGYGNNLQPTQHAIYTQTPRLHFILNWEEGSVTGSEGSACWSNRGPMQSFDMYNRCRPKVGTTYTSASGGSGDTEVQGNNNYARIDYYFGYQGNGPPNCTVPFSASADCKGSFGGIAWYAAQVEAHNNYNIGNLLWASNDSRFQLPKMLGIGNTNGDGFPEQVPRQFNGYNTFAVDGTVAKGGQIAEDRRYANTVAGLQDMSPVWPRVWFQNNIIAWQANNACPNPTCYTFGTSSSSVINFGHNLVTPNQVTTTAPFYAEMPAAPAIPVGAYRLGFSQRAWQPDFIPQNPINEHLNGWTASNFPTYNPANGLPYDTTTFRPKADAIGTAAACSDQLCFYPPWFNAFDESNPGIYTLRQDFTTPGAYDSGAPTVTTGFTLPAGNKLGHNSVMR